MDLKFYWNLLLKRLPWMAAIFLVCTVLGIALAIRLPTTYQSSARLLVEAPQIPGDLAATTVRVAASEEVEIIRQQLLTRANLIDIANDFKVFSREAGLSPDEIVQSMRERTQISSQGGGGGPRDAPTPTLMTIGFEAPTGRIAADVVNEYVTRVVNASVRQRTGTAEDTLDFFEQEAERLSNELDRRSARISEFQGKNADALPDNLDFRLNRQSLLQERLAAAERERSSLKDQRERILAVFEATGTLGARPDEQLTQEERNLRDLESQMLELRAVLSETNPRVLTLQARIDGMRRTIEAQAAQNADDAVPDSGNTMLDIQLAEIDSRVDSLETERASIETELEKLGGAIAETPQNAIVLQSLKRDYENTRQQYDRAVQSLSQASIGERIELTARGQRIALIEPANVPDEPASPNRPMVAASGIGSGLALSVAIFVLLELLNRTVRRPAEIISALGITPLATVPYIESRGRRLTRRAARIALLLAVIIGVPIVLWAVDTYYLPLDLLFARLMDKLGLG